jgi:uncharacterized protein (TIGR02996 family)
VEDEAFLRAIEAAPGDESLRLVYADWLEERDDPRGEYLRLEEKLRAMPYASPDRQAAGRRWRESRASLDPAWLRRVEGDAILPSWALRAAGRPSRSGVVDYYEWMRQNHWEWVILAVLAPLEAVVRELIASRLRSTPEAALSSGIWLPQVPLSPPGQEGDEVSPLTPLVQLRGQGWTVALYDIFNLTMPSYSSAQEDARLLSERLATVALEFSSEDTSGSTGYHLFECGELVEYAEWGCLDQWASKKRPGPPWQVFPPDYPEELFRKCGLYIPSFYARRDADGPGIVLRTPAPEEVERADLMALRGAFHADEPAAVLQMRASVPMFHVHADELGLPDESREGDGLPDHPPQDNEIPF